MYEGRCEHGYDFMKRVRCVLCSASGEWRLLSSSCPFSFVQFIIRKLAIEGICLLFLMSGRNGYSRTCVSTGRARGKGKHRTIRSAYMVICF